MNRTWGALSRLIAAIWLGSALFFAAVAAPAAFRSSPPNAAANVVGAMLTGWHLISVVAPAAILALAWARRRLARTAILVVLVAAITLAATELAVDLYIRHMRAVSPVPISELSPSDPYRRKFGRLHGVSAMLLLLQIGTAASFVVLDDESNPQS